MDKPAFNRGIYSVRTASRLLHIRTGDVSRWAFGYRGQGQDYPPVIATDLPELEGRRAITFLELVELMFIRVLRGRGHSLHKIRAAWEVLRRIFNIDHPFALKTCFEDPGGLYALVAHVSGDDLLVELRGAAQLAMLPALESYLRQLEFGLEGENQIAARWHPAGPEQPIVVDPRVAFGTPVITATAIPTSAIARLADSGSDADEIAWWYDVDAWKVDAALEYERSLLVA